MLFHYIPAVQEVVLSVAEPSASPFGAMMPMLIMMMVVMYFIVLRPQQKKDRARRDMLDALSKGDEVVTSGGIHGKIVGVDESKVVLKVSDEPLLKLEFARSSIAFVVQDESK